MSNTMKSVLVVVLFALLTGGIVGFQSPASAASCLVISRISYNSPGADTRSNTSLNGEWIQLHNQCRTASVLTNAKVKDAAGHIYKFSSYSLGGGKYVRVRTGRGTNTSTDRYQVLADKCSYNNPRATAVSC